MTEERRSSERRDDPNVWSPRHRKQVQTVYAMVVGGVIVLAGLIIISWAIMQEGDPNLIALGVGGGVCLIGLVASMPKTFMPLLSFVLKRLPFLKGTPPSISEITALSEAADLSEFNIPKIVPEESEDGP